ncbi:MAG: hypothetical protein II309_02735 [Bacilli bacterium]|nr:hypothetical protein [Bacilli bacterium]
MSDKKVDFDLNKLSQDELLKVYENIKSFLDYLEDNKIDLSEESEEANE